jgi:hypothetical protein
MERGFRAPTFIVTVALFAAIALSFSGRQRVRAQTPPAPTAHPTAVPTPVPAGQIQTPTPTSPATSLPPTPTPFPGSVTEQPMFPGVAETPGPPTAPPTQPPIIVDPATAAVEPGHTQFLHVMQVLGGVAVTVADPTIADATIDQTTRILAVSGKVVGTTTVTVVDSRGLTRVVPVRVALDAGTIAPEESIRITGRPATEAFIREAALNAATAGAVLRPGASVVASADAIVVHQPLASDDIMDVDVPITLAGDSYFNVTGTTTVHVENYAQPMVRPQHLLVSDFPETLKESGILFTADLTARDAQRFLYYHYNPGGQPDRRIVLHVQNPSNEPALVQLIAGTAGPESNEMEVGHLSTQRFLVHLAQNEGTVVQIPANSTVDLLVQGLPAKTVVSGLLQLHEIDGADLHLTLVAENASDPVDMPTTNLALLEGDHPHARGIYPIPEFYFDYAYDAEGPNLEIPIGQIPLPNLVQGQTLAGDYGVLQSVTIRMVNNDRHNARQIAIYVNPRGGRATGTFLIDRVLVQAHALAPYTNYKLRQYTIAPGSFVRTEIITMPEGGSSYPLRIVVGPDDGSAAPGAPDSPIY